VGGAVAFILLFYTLLYPIKGFRVALGSDTPVYEWWARYAGARGLGSFAHGRPAIVAVIAAAAGAAGRQTDTVTAALAPVLAAMAGLGLAALVDEALGRDRSRFVLVATLTGAFLSLMVPGYLSTMAFGALLVGALACLASDLTRDPAARRWGPLAGAAMLWAGAGLSHTLFLALGGSVAAGGIVALLPTWRRDAAAGVPLPRRALSRLVMGAAGGVALTGAGLLAASGPVVRTLDTSRDSVLRRAGLDDLVRRSYRRKLVHDFSWYRVATVVALAMTPLASVWRRSDPVSGIPGRNDARRMFLGVMVAWVVLTDVGILALLAGTGAPGQRLAAFCLPLPALAGIGLAGLSRRGRPWLAAAVGGAILWLVVAWLGWGNQRPLATPKAVLETQAAGRLLAQQPGGTPLILVMDNRSGKSALFVIRALNYLRDAVPGERVPDVYGFVGSPSDLRAGHPSHTGQPEHDQLADDLWVTLKPVEGRRPLAVVLREFDPRAFREAAGIHPPRSGVAVVAGFEGSPSSHRPATGAPEGLPSPWEPVWLSFVLLIGFGVAGWPWAWAMVPTSPLRTQLALAPAFGYAAVAFAGIAFDAAGIRLSGAAWMVVLVAAAGGALVAIPLRPKWWKARRLR